MATVKPKRRFAVSVHTTLGPHLVEECTKTGRSLSGTVNWILFTWLKEKGYPVNAEDLSEWHIRHNIIEGRKAAEAERAAVEQSNVKQEESK